MMVGRVGVATGLPHVEAPRGGSAAARVRPAAAVHGPRARQGSSALHSVPPRLGAGVGMGMRSHREIGRKGMARSTTRVHSFDPASAFEDVDVAIGNYMSVKAVQLVMLQLRELNPEKYTVFYQFVHDNSNTLTVSLGRSKKSVNDAFLEKLVVFDRDLAERVMKTRVYLFKEWCAMFNDYRKLEAASRMEQSNLGLLQKNLMASFSLDTIDHPLDPLPDVPENVE